MPHYPALIQRFSIPPTAVCAGPLVNVAFSHLLHRIRAEYREMPGLQLSTPQAQRLFDLDSETWAAVRAALVEARFLSQTRDGLFAMV